MRAVNHLSSKAACRIIGGVFDMTLSRFPAAVRIETTNACNAKCTICPHSEIARPIARMDDELFTRIIDECARGGCQEAHLHNFGEPLLDKHLEDRVRYAKQRGLRKVKIFTNGSLLGEERARGLIDAGLDEIKVSFDGATREEFEQIRVPLKYDQVVENIKGLVALRDAMRSAMKVRVACCSTTDKDGTMQSLEKTVDGFSFGKIHNWASEDYTNGQSKIRKPCSRLWRTFTILVDGQVALCCLDYDGQFTLGRLDAGTSIRDVWTGAAYRQVRARHKEARQDEISLCRHCTKSFF
ncbi:MAG: SPASM domain-containing protein [Pirellulales bacterium]|nr:SPASM domain-containing protein [Pirellulales bacterium]